MAKKKKEKPDPNYLEMQRKAKMYTDRIPPDYDDILLEIDDFTSNSQTVNALEQYVRQYEVYHRLLVSEAEIEEVEQQYTDDQHRHAEGYRKKICAVWQISCDAKLCPK